LGLVLPSSKYPARQADRIERKLGARVFTAIAFDLEVTAPAVKAVRDSPYGYDKLLPL
jgi:hypothetical protein